MPTNALSVVSELAASQHNVFTRRQAAFRGITRKQLHRLIESGVIVGVKLGGGPTVMIYDARMIPNLKLRNLVIDTAAELNIPLQFSNMPGGSTDGGVIHVHGLGVPTVVMGVPSRHIHSHGSIIHRNDYDHAVQLVAAVVAKLDATTVAGLTE